MEPKAGGVSKAKLNTAMTLAINLLTISFKGESSCLLSMQFVASNFLNVERKRVEDRGESVAPESLRALQDDDSGGI